MAKFSSSSKNGFGTTFEAVSSPSSWVLALLELALRVGGNMHRIRLRVLHRNRSEAKRVKSFDLFVVLIGH